MRSRPIGAGQSILASQKNDHRDDARGGSFLLAHQQLGALALGTLPSNGQVIPIVINGTTITLTAVSTIGSTPNNILIPTSGLAKDFTANVVNFCRRPDITNTNQVAASGANQTLLSYVGWAWPGASTNIVPFSLNKNVNGITGALTSFNITGITVTSGTWTAQTMQLYVEDGTYYINGTRYLFTGGSTPTVTAPVSNPRIDVLTIDTSGTLAWTTGTENASPVAPSYPSDKLAICELYNVVSETALYDNEDQQVSQGYILNDVRPTASIGPILTAIASDLIPDGNNTRNFGSGGNQWNNAYINSLFLNGVLQTGSKFGGTGADGALSISSGTTTINLGSAAVVVKNYTSISITGTGQLAFSNPAAGGTIVILKSQGNVTITSSTNPAIDLRSVGGSGASATSGSGAPGGGGNAFGNWIAGTITGTGGGAGNGNPGAGGGGGGASASTNGSAGTTGSSGTSGGSGGSTPLFAAAAAQYVKVLVVPGGGGGGGGNQFGHSSGGGAGGSGGGALYLECAGALNVTSTLNAAGAAGSNGSDGGGGGGGGGGIVILYGTLTANSGTFTVSGGSGGTAGTSCGAGGAGANGYSLVAANTEFA